MSSNRRDALKKIGWGGLGIAATPLWCETLNAFAEERAQAIQAGAPAAVDWTPKALSAHQNELVAAVSELIMPQTDTPGAAAAHVNRFVDAVMDDADEAERKSFLRGLDWLDARSREVFGDEFLKASPEQQAALLTLVSSKKNTALEDQIGVEFFKAIKGLTITGFYTSEIGMKESGDLGQLFFAGFEGCTHPEHGGTPRPR